MAPRQYARKIRAGSARFEDVYRAVSEYRQQYPDKAVVYSAQKAPELCWASLLAGGSCAAIPVIDKAFLEELSLMAPRPSDSQGVYLLEGPNGFLVYNDADYTLDLKSGKYALYQIDRKTGNISYLRDVTESSILLSNQHLWWLKRKL